MIHREESPGMTLVVRTVARFSSGLILLFGAYLMVYGHVLSGGGFAGGVTIALGFVNMMLAYGKDTALRKVSEQWSFGISNLAIFLMMGLGILGLIFGGSFLANFLREKIPAHDLANPFTSGTILIYNGIVFLVVGMGLVSVLITLILFKIEDEQ